MNKDVLVALIAKDIKELAIMTTGLEEMKEVPLQYLQLACVKAKLLATNLDNLYEIETNSGDNVVVISQNEEESALEAEKLAKEAAEVQRQAALEVQRQAEAEAAEARRIEEEQKAAEAEACRVEAERLAVEEAERLEAQRKAEEEAAAEVQRQAAEARRIEEEQNALEAEARKVEEQRQAEVQRQAEAAAAEAHRIEEEQNALEEEAKNTKVDNVADEIVLQQQPQVTTVADAIETSEALIDRLSQSADTTIASSIGMQKINDLKSAITIVDRFRFQRELFAGDAAKMNKAIAEFENMTSIEEAEMYIVKSFDSWDMESPVVVEFMQLLRRRYI